MRWTAWSTAPPLLLALAREAGAQQAPQAPPAAPGSFPRAELDYQVAAGLDCPTAEQLRADVAKELTYDAFDGGPGFPVGRFHVAVSRGRRGVLLIRMTLDDVSGKQDFETRFEGTPVTARTCSHLVTKHVASEIVMVLSVKEMRLLLKPAPPRAACPAPSSEPAGSAPAPCPDSRFSVWPTEWPLPPLEKPRPDSPKPPERWPVAVRGGVAVWPELIASGWGSFGLSAEIGARYRAFSAGVELHGDPPLGAQSRADGNVSFARVSGALLLCAHFGFFAGCGVGDAGRFIFPDHVPALPASAFYGAVGARASLEFPVAPPRLFLRTSMDLRAPIHPASYAIMGRNIFAVAGLGAGLGLGLILELPP